MRSRFADVDVRTYTFKRNVATADSASVSNVINTSLFATRFARRSFGITILLAMVAVDIISSELLPICPEYLFIDVMVAVSILFAFLALVETCLGEDRWRAKRRAD